MDFLWGIHAHDCTARLAATRHKIINAGISHHSAYTKPYWATSLKRSYPAVVERTEGRSSEVWVPVPSLSWPCARTLAKLALPESVFPSSK